MDDDQKTGEYEHSRFRASSEAVTFLWANNDDFIFLIGPARSGTTIAVEILNSANDCIILSEDNAFVNYYIKDFPGWFNAAHHEANGLRSKGCFIPDFGSNQKGWAESYRRLKMLYPKVGSKIAFGPHGYWKEVEAEFLDFFCALFPRSQYVLCVRNPWLVLRSMRRKFSGVSTVDLLDSLGRTYRQLMLTVCNMSRVVLLDHDRADSYRYRLLLQQLGVNAVLGSQVVVPPSDREPICSDVECVLLSEEISSQPDVRPRVSRCIAAMLRVHEHLLSVFDRETGMLSGNILRGKLYAVLLPLIEDVLRAVAEMSLESGRVSGAEKLSGQPLES